MDVLNRQAGFWTPRSKAPTAEVVTGMVLRPYSNSQMVCRSSFKMRNTGTRIYRGYAPQPSGPSTEGPADADANLMFFICPIVLGNPKRQGRISGCPEVASKHRIEVFSGNSRSHGSEFLTLGTLTQNLETMSRCQYSILLAYWALKARRCLAWNSCKVVASEHLLSYPTYPRACNGITTW